MINATQEYFMKTNSEQKLRIIACTANATLLIGGTTIHYLLGLLINKHDIVRPNLITSIWPTIEFIIVDKISMVVCNMLFTMHLKLQKLKSNILPFRGVNIFFMGDFLQFPPITNTPLYSNNIQPTFAFTKLTQKKNHK
jgi:ATP-dependent DNA helicase PIF1